MPGKQHTICPMLQSFLPSNVSPPRALCPNTHSPRNSSVYDQCKLQENPGRTSSNKTPNNNVGNPQLHQASRTVDDSDPADLKRAQHPSTRRWAHDHLTSDIPAGASLVKHSCCPASPCLLHVCAAFRSYATRKSLLVTLAPALFASPRLRHRRRGAGTDLCSAAGRGARTDLCCSSRRPRRRRRNNRCSNRRSNRSRRRGPPRRWRLHASKQRQA